MNTLLYKKRGKSVTYRVLECLNVRMELENSERIKYKKQVKGFDGELQFDLHMDQAAEKGILVNDLVLNHNNSIFQIDSLLILGDIIYLYEVKNYAGSYSYKKESFLSESNYEIVNPISQLNRSKILLSNLLKKYGFNYNLKGYVVFMNPSFELFYMPPDLPFILYGQLSSHIQWLKNQPYKSGNEPIKLAKKLKELHIVNYRPDNLPEYDFDDLKKGSYCLICLSYSFTSSRKNRFCNDCGYKEKTVDTIKRSIDEFHIIFPEEKLTTQKIYHWCGRDFQRPRIRKVLKKYYKAIGNTSSTYFE